MGDAITHSFVHCLFFISKLLMFIICQALKYTLREMQGCLRLSKNFYSVGKKPEVEQNAASAFKRHSQWALEAYKRDQ